MNLLTVSFHLRGLSIPQFDESTIERLLLAGEHLVEERWSANRGDVLAERFYLGRHAGLILYRQARVREVTGSTRSTFAAIAAISLTRVVMATPVMVYNDR